MQSNDRLKMFRSLGLAIAALLLVGGAVFGSQAISGQNHRPDANETPGASADESGDVQNGDASNNEDPSESPEASPDQNVNENVNDQNGSPEESSAEHAAQSPEPSESENASPDQQAGDSGDGAGAGD